MIVNRTSDQKNPATMTLYFREGGSGTIAESQAIDITSTTDGRSKAPPPTSNERIVTIDMKFQEVEKIAEEFMRQTGAKAVQPTPQEEEELQEDELRKQRGDIDRVRTAKEVQERRREEQLLRQARNEVAAMKATA
jgi:large subunit ribosomal protein MRP49